MTKQKLWKRWGIYSNRYILNQEDFFEDLEAWYDSRRIKELNAIKEELVKSFKEMDNAVIATCDDTNWNMSACTRLGKNGDCLSSELCGCCDNPPTHFLKGYDCYD